MIGCLDFSSCLGCGVDCVWFFMDWSLLDYFTKDWFIVFLTDHWLVILACWRVKSIRILSFSKVTRTFTGTNHLFFTRLIIIPLMRAIDIDLNFHLADFVTLSTSLFQILLCFNWSVHNLGFLQILVLNCI